MKTLIQFIIFGFLAILWLAFLGAWVFDRALLDTIWRVYQNMPVGAQIVLGIMTLPVALGMWVLHTPWAMWIRLALVIILAVGSLWAFLPRED